MSEQTGKSLEDLKEMVDANAAETAGEAAAAVPPEQQSDAPRQPVIDEHGRSYATGRRKESVARVWVKPGKGQIQVNGKDAAAYFARPVLQMIIKQPFDVSGRNDQYDVYCTVTGGGLSGQAGAVRHGISQALSLFEPALRSPLKQAGFLTRDARTVERKKYGRRKARRSFQFSKR